MKIFKPADIMLPNCDMHRWSVVACDQFTSEPEYWQQVRSIVGDSPSTLHMMLPEAELGLKDPEAESVKINATMQRYIDEGVFKTYPDSYIYLERTLKNGAVRRGIMGMFDLEAYDWAEGTHSPIRATEHTVEDRLPPRIRIRRNAPLEMPHIMIFMDDADNIVFSSVTKGEKVYDFELMQDGGSIAGWLVADTEKLAKAAEKLGDEAVLQRKYGSAYNAIIFAMGDGNHSLAEAKAFFADNIGEGRSIDLVTGEGIERLNISGLTIGELIGKCEDFCKAYTERHGGYIDYIHGDCECVEMSQRFGCAGILLPRMEKSELFSSVMKSGPFPKKSFSIGHGNHTCCRISF